MRQSDLAHLLRIRLRLQSEEGFTLIELLVTMIIGFIVLGALFTIQTVTLHQTTRLFSKVDATQHVRVAVEQVENELHSACITSNVTPIQTGSTASNLIFVSQYGTAAALTPVEHQVVFNSAAATLTDNTYALTSSSQAPDGSPIYTFATTPTTTRTLLKNVAQTGTTPVFQYFAYQAPMNGASPYTDSAGDPYMMLLDGTSVVPGTSTIPSPSPLTVPLSSTDAANAAEVMISLTGGPQGGTGENTHLNDVGDPIADAVVLRLTPAPNHAGNGVAFLPCQ
jgi:type II secretory pathway pseudopilin PulG